MSDTIKINREMLRAAFLEVDAKIAHRNMNVEELELKLFGPRKPREVMLRRCEGGLSLWTEVTRENEISGNDETMRVREVLDGE